MHKKQSLNNLWSKVLTAVTTKYRHLRRNGLQYCGCSPMFRKNILLTSSRSKNKTSKKPAKAGGKKSVITSYRLLFTVLFLPGLLFYPEDQGSTLFRNVCEHLPDYLTLCRNWCSQNCGYEEYYFLW
jgi:hypothetical protein